MQSLIGSILNPRHHTLMRLGFAELGDNVRVKQIHGQPTAWGCDAGAVLVSECSDHHAAQVRAAEFSSWGERAPASHATRSPVKGPPPRRHAVSRSEVHQ